MGSIYSFFNVGKPKDLKKSRAIPLPELTHCSDDGLCPSLPLKVYLYGQIILAVSPWMPPHL